LALRRTTVSDVPGLGGLGVGGRRGRHPRLKVRGDVLQGRVEVLTHDDLAAGRQQSVAVLVIGFSTMISRHRFEGVLRRRGKI